MRRRDSVPESIGISNLMVRDALTGVYAKSALHDRLEEEVNRAQRYGEAFSLLLLDLDHFKSVNDAFGHARGDATLTEFVTRVQHTARNSDVLFRYGGDEFVLFLPRTTHEQAQMLAERLSAQVSETPFSGQPPLSLAVSIGVATLPEDASSAADLLARADARMYDVKRGSLAHEASADAVASAGALLDGSTRLIERLDALLAANRFFDALPLSIAALLRISGVPGCGASRMIAELEQLARLRGLRVVSQAGGIAAELAEALAMIGPQATVLTIDDIDKVSPAALDRIREILLSATTARPIGLIYTGRNFDLGPGGESVPHESITLLTLSRDGVRAWLRSAFRWEPPPEFVEWLHDQSAGVPKAVRRLVLQLVERKMLAAAHNGWQLAQGFREIAGSPGGMRRTQTRGLRAHMLPLVDRDDEFRQLLRLVSTTRLTMLVGAAGIGKTRLATELASEAAERFADGVAFVNVHPHMTVLELASSIALTLDIESLPGPDPWAALARQLRHRKLLIILDGTDGVRGADEAVGTLLDLALDVHVLAIARRPLRSDGWVFHLGGLRVPESSESETVEVASSVRLFQERSAYAGSQTSLQMTERRSIQRICQLVDGSPLSLELVAALTASLSCREIAEELDAVLGGIVAYMPAIPRDEQRARAALDQAWHALSESERTVLRKASLFAAEFDVAAAGHIAHASEHDLDRLVALGLIARSGGGLYALHPLVRDYARGKLDGFADQRHETAALFSAHYLGLAQECATRLRDAETTHAAAAEFTRELPNIRRAWILALVEDRYDLVAMGAVAWYEFFESRRYAAEAESLFCRALTWVEAAQVDAVEANAAVGHMLRARHGASLLQIGRVDDARQRLLQALDGARTLGNASEQAFCLRYLALAEHAAGHVATAQEEARAAVALVRETADPHALVGTLRDAAAVVGAGGGAQNAVEYLLEAVSVEAPSSAKAGAWRALLQAVEPIVTQGVVPLPGAVLLQIINDPAADEETVARAQRLLESLTALQPAAEVHSNRPSPQMT